MKPAVRKYIEFYCGPLLDKYCYPYDSRGKVRRVGTTLMKVLPLGDAVSLFRFRIRERAPLSGITLVLSLYSTSGER